MHISSPMNSSRFEFFSGVRAQLPLLLGVVPFGLIYGALAVQVGVPATVAQAMSSVIFAGSAQFIAAPLIVASTPPLVLILTVFVVNLRHLLYSASVAPFLEHLSPSWKALLSYLLTDEAYAVSIAHFHQAGDGAKRHWFLFGAGLTLWASWQLSTAIGIFIGARVPPEWSLDFALPLTFIAIVVPMIKNRAHVTAALVAAVSGVVAFMLPYKLAYIVASMAGIAVGMAVFTWMEKRWMQR
ncbi:MAG: AzlC family ABC transporter permease [Syntrophaceae bacterium]|nr:AzlC family ABC transporter permease [Syntrophaceae bacterium]